MEALVTAAAWDNPDAAAVLIRTGLDIDTPGLQTTPLQAASSEPWGRSMMQFLISQGANVNVPAHPDQGRTVLQAVLESKNAIEAAEILLSHGADASAPPATQDGLTALEALCHNSHHSVCEGSEGQKLCHKLLDAGATVNRPGGGASSALHGVIEKGWHEVLARFLEP